MRKIWSILIIVFTMAYVFTVLEIKNSILEKVYYKTKQILYNVKNVDLRNNYDANTKIKVVYNNLNESSKNVDLSDYYSLNDKQYLSVYDKERLLSLAKEISSIDQEKIKACLEDNTITEVKEAMNIFKNRLSDKQYDKIKDIELKYNKNSHNN